MASISVVAPSHVRPHTHRSTGRGVFGTVLDAIMRSRQITADRQIAEVIGRRSGIPDIFGGRSRP